MTTTRRAPMVCHRCGYQMDAATPTDGGDKVPGVGDVAICLACGALGVFTQDNVRAPTAPEMKEFLADPEIRKAVRAINTFHTSQRPPAAPPSTRSNGDTYVPCGCVFGTRGDAFFIRPCSLTCEVYLYAAAQSKKQGKPMHVMREGA